MFKSDLLIICYHGTKQEQDTLIEPVYNSLKKVNSSFRNFRFMRRKRLNFLCPSVRKVLVVLTRVRLRNQRFRTYRLFLFELLNGIVSCSPRENWSYSA